MAIQIPSNIDFNTNEAVSFVIETSTARPSTDLVEGRLVDVTAGTNQGLNLYTGGEWTLVDSDTIDIGGLTALQTLADNRELVVHVPNDATQNYKVTVGELLANAGGATLHTWNPDSVDADDVIITIEQGDFVQIDIQEEGAVLPYIAVTAAEHTEWDNAIFLYTGNTAVTTTQGQTVATTTQ